MMFVHISIYQSIYPDYHSRRIFMAIQTERVLFHELRKLLFDLTPLPSLSSLFLCSMAQMATRAVLLDMKNQYVAYEDMKCSS